MDKADLERMLRQYSPGAYARQLERERMQALQAEAEAMYRAQIHQQAQSPFSPYGGIGQAIGNILGKAFSPSLAKPTPPTEIGFGPQESLFDMAARIRAECGVPVIETVSVAPDASVNGWIFYDEFSDIPGDAQKSTVSPRIVAPDVEVGFGPREVALSPVKPPIPGVRHHLFNPMTDFCVHCGVSAEQALDNQWHCTPATHSEAAGETIARAIRWHR